MDNSVGDGLIDIAKWVPSPNFDERPEGAIIDLLVIHNISLPAGKFDGDYVEQLFTNCLDCDIHPDFRDLKDLKVSCHFFIKRNGELIQFVNCELRAWHAGISEHNGRNNCNDFSLGIELEGTDDKPYTDAQYLRLSELTKILMSLYPALTTENIVGHSDIAPSRKSDPGIIFDWDRYKTGLI
ncbi:MAG: 1,6-anhydro-N-acetylmuramyl-L-alanine amidase AmpD [Halieaceae bacterium]|nr:1,6-anhydro-N-acetylmuramyl-L-alanine amidase AmpD [Halieaceae bacterium]